MRIGPSRLALAIALLATPGRPVQAASFTDHQLGDFYPLHDVDDGVLQRASDAVVRFPGATGFLVDARGYIMTNHHVRQSFGRGGTVWRRWTDDGAAEALEVTLVFDDEAHDIAVYQIDDPQGPYPALEIRRTAPRVGEAVAVLGHPDGDPLRASYGKILADGLHLSGRPSVEYSAQTWWGSSGSPVLDRHGRAIAIHWGWDSEGLSNGRLTGVPFDVLLDEVPRLRALLSPPAASACDDASAWSIDTTLVRAGTRTNARGRDLDALEVRVVPPSSSCAAAVRQVTFGLHPTFSNPQPTVRGLAPLSLQAWGRFDATATVQHTDGRELLVRGRVTW